MSSQDTADGFIFVVQSGASQVPDEDAAVAGGGCQNISLLANERSEREIGRMYCSQKYSGAGGRCTGKRGYAWGNGKGSWEILGGIRDDTVMIRFEFHFLERCFMVSTEYGNALS